MRERHDAFVRLEAQQDGIEPRLRRIPIEHLGALAVDLGHADRLRRAPRTESCRGVATKTRTGASAAWTALPCVSRAAAKTRYGKAGFIDHLLGGLSGGPLPAMPEASNWNRQEVPSSR